MIYWVIEYKGFLRISHISVFIIHGKSLMKRDYQSHSLFIKAADNLHSRFSFHHHSSQMFTNAYFYSKKKTLIEYFNFIISILCKHLMFICFWLSHSRSMRHRRLRLAVYLFDYFLNLFIRITAIEDIYIVIELSWVKLSEEFKCVYICKIKTHGW